MKIIKTSVLFVNHFISGKHFLFKCSIANNENQLIIDNESEAQIFHESFARKLKLKIIELRKKNRIKLEFDDEKIHQIIKKIVIVSIKIKNHEEKLFCYLIDIKSHILIVENDWLQSHNSRIDWIERIMTFSNNCIKKECSPQSYSITAAKEKLTFSSDKNSFKKATSFEKTISFEKMIQFKNIEFENFDIQIFIQKRFMKLLKRSNCQIYCLYLKNKLNKKINRYENKMLIVIIINVVILKNHEKFIKKKIEYILKELKKRIFETYHCEIEVFMKTEIDKLAFHRKNDHEINLLSKIKSSFIRNYRSMSEQKLIAMKKYLNEHLIKNFIRSNSSKTAAFVLLMKKSEENFRFCVNYRNLNNIIKKNKYSIFFFSETLTKFVKTKWFIKLNIIHVFNRIKIKKKHKWLTAFNTKYGQFEYLIMLFELCNASSTFQSYINSSFRKYLNYFVTIYLNDILIFSDTEFEHIEQILKIFRRFKKKNLQLNIDKCEFFVFEIKYLEMYVNVNDVKMNSEKVFVILKWRISESVKKIQSFFEFVNFYRKFIEEFFKKVKCLTKLIKKKQYVSKSKKRRVKYKNFHWTTECRKIFENMKQVFTSAFVFVHYDSVREIWMKTNALNFVIFEVLFQMHDNVLKSIVYFSKKMISVECNYEIYDKELLAIVKNFAIWKSELMRVKDFVKIYFDHKNLKIFMTIKQLNRRQVRWTKMFAKYNFRVMYRSDKQENKFDVLTKKKQNLSANAENDRTKYQHQILLKKHQLNDEIKKNLKLYAIIKFMTQNDSEFTFEYTFDYEIKFVFESKKKANQKVSTNDDSSNSLKELLKTIYQKNDIVQKIMKAKFENFRKLFEKILKKNFKLTLKNLKIREKRLFYKKRFFVSHCDKLKLHFFRNHHDPSIHEHSKYREMYVKLLKNYFWIIMKKNCRRYAVNCSICRRSKAYNDQKQKLLTPLFISQKKWRDLFLNFVVKLPKCHRRGRIYENILMIVNRLTKRRLYESMTEIKIKAVLKILERRVFSTYDLSDSIFHDRNTQLVTHFWKRICQRYDIKSKSFSAYHSETNNQTENANKIMKNYFRVYVKHTQNDWVDYLFETKFAVNNHVNVFIEMISFFADHDYHLRSDIESFIHYDNDTVGRAELLSADQIAARQEAMKKWLVDNFTWTQIDQTKYVNNFRTSHLDYKINDWIYVNTKNFSIEKQSQSLNSKNVDSWKIIRCIDNKTYELNISEHLKQTGLTIIFHSWKFHLAFFNSFSEQVIQPSSSLLIQGDFETTSHEEYEMLEIIDCRDIKKYDIQYKTIYIES